MCRLLRISFAFFIRCHEGYKLRTYPLEQEVIAKQVLVGQGLGGRDIEMPAITLHTLNSQAAEQFNAKLNQISTQCAYMKQSNFMAFVKYYLYRCNANIWEGWVKKYSVPIS